MRKYEALGWIKPKGHCGKCMLTQERASGGSSVTCCRFLRTQLHYCKN